jgi:MFS family permease
MVAVPLTRLLPASPVLRGLTGATLVNTFGNGLFFTTGALFFTRSVGLTPAQLGLGLAIAGACGIVGSPPLGWLGDRWGHRRVLMAACAAEGAGMLGYGFVHSFATFLPLTCALTFLDRGANGVRNALVAIALPAAERSYGRAYLRAVTNVGIGAGAAAAALALQSGTRAAYLLIVAGDAVTFLAAAALLAVLRTPPVPGRGEPAGGVPGQGKPGGGAAAGRQRARPPGRHPLTDGPYLLITALNGILNLQVGLLQVGVPLWIARFTHAPRVTVSVVFVVNTVMVVCLQVRASRGTEEPRYAARVCRRAGFLLTAACAAYGLARGLPAAAAVAVLLAGAAVQTLAEVLSAAAGWALSYDLADQSAHGSYQGVFNSGFSAGILLAPAVVAVTALRFGLPGWLALGGVFALAGAALPVATRWALAQRRARGGTVV